MSSEIKYPRGSEWRRWDLHVHSPESHNYSGNWIQFLEQLSNADCEVIGINDYFSVAGYKKLMEILETGVLKEKDGKIRRIDANIIASIKKKVFFPVVEFRMTQMLKHRRGSGATHFNFHIIFSDAIDIAEIENKIKAQESGGTQISEDYNDQNKLMDKKISFGSLSKDLSSDKKFKNKF